MDKDNGIKFETLKEEPEHISQKPVNLGTPAHPFPKFLPKKIALIIIALLISAFVIGGIKQLLSLKNDQTKVEYSQRPTLIPTPTTESISKWNVYEDEFLSFKYPSSSLNLEKKGSDIYIKEKGDNISGWFMSYDKDYFINTSKLEKCSEIEKDPQTQIEITGCLPIESNNETVSTINLDGNHAEEFKITIPGRGGNLHYVQLSNPQIVFMNWYSEELFKEILSTIRLK